MLANRLKTLNPYKPGEQLKDREYIKLNANENPFSPPKEVAEAVSNLLNTNLKSLSLYPDPDSTDLRIEIASFLNKTGGVLANIPEAKKKLNFEITPEMIFCGNGSDEVLSFVFYAFFDDDKKVVTPEFSYSFYPVYAGYYGIELEKVPLKPDFSLDTEKMLEFGKSSSGMIFANPNAPTGIALSTAQIKEMLDNFPKDKVFVVDEAYADFSSERSFLLDLDKYPNLIVLQTFSKAWGCAAIRLGMAFACPQIIGLFNKIKYPYNVNLLTQQEAISLLQDPVKIQDWIRILLQERTRLMDEFSKLSCCETIYPTDANFFLTKVTDAKKIYEYLVSKGIIVRNRTHVALCGNCLRITIGTSEENDTLLEALKGWV